MEIADLQCPFCAQYSVQVLPTIVRDYVRTGKVNYELRIRSFLGRDSVRAAGAAAAAAKQDLMFQFADLFFRNQGPENSDYADDAFMRMIAEQVPGLDADAVVAAADDPLGPARGPSGTRCSRARSARRARPTSTCKKGESLTPITAQGTAPRTTPRRSTPPWPPRSDPAPGDAACSRWPAWPSRATSRSPLREARALLRRRRGRLRARPGSQWAELVGIPVAVLGLIGYATILASLALPESLGAPYAAFASLVGFGFSAWLTYVELEKIQAVCQWCVASAVVMTALAVVSTARLLRGAEPSGLAA